MSSHGNFHWNESMSRDVESAKRFYRDTVGRTYWCAAINSKPVAGIGWMTPAS